MKKRGAFKTIFSIIISITVLFAIVYFFSTVNQIEENLETVEILNLKTSIQTKILQQSVKTAGSMINYTISTPSSVSQICFFDTQSNYNQYSNVELEKLYSDNVNNLYIKIDEDYVSYSIDKIELENNPICFSSKNNKVTIKIKSIGNSSSIEGGQVDGICTSILENGDPQSKIDIVYLGYGFESTEEYNDEINRYTNNILLEFEPFIEFKNKFNFYRIDSADLDCEISSYISCDEYKVNLAASQCPVDYIFVLVDRNIVSDFVKPVRSSSVRNIAKINTADKPFVIVHEFGHLFGELADEYVDENYYSENNFNPNNYANCDYSPCNIWEELNETGCYQGCSLGRFFRPTKMSIMRSLSSPEFGPLGEQELEKRLLYYE